MVATARKGAELAPIWRGARPGRWFFFFFQTMGAGDIGLGVLLPGNPVGTALGWRFLGVGERGAAVCQAFVNRVKSQWLQERVPASEPYYEGSHLCLAFLANESVIWTLLVQEACLATHGISILQNSGIHLVYAAEEYTTAGYQASGSGGHFLHLRLDLLKVLLELLHVGRLRRPLDAQALFLVGLRDLFVTEVGSRGQPCAFLDDIRSRPIPPSYFLTAIGRRQKGHSGGGGEGNEGVGEFREEKGGSE